MRAQLAPITLVTACLSSALSSYKPGRKQIVTGLPLPAHGGERRHAERDHDVDLMVLFELVELPTAADFQ